MLVQTWRWPPCPKSGACAFAESRPESSAFAGAESFASSNTFAFASSLPFAESSSSASAVTGSSFWRYVEAMGG